MKVSKIVPNKISRFVGRRVLETKKNSPHIFFVGGIVGVVGGTVLACKATLKLEDTLDEIKKDLQEVKEHTQSPKYSDQDHNKDLLYVYSKSAVRLGKLYGPAIVVGGISIAALTGSHVQLTRRNVALSSTLSVVTAAYEKYRERVQEELGKEKELDIYRGIKNEEITVDGTKHKVRSVDPNGLSPYARFFDEASTEWRKSSELNRIFIQCQQNYANHLLRARGHLFLNEVYDALGLERSGAGQVVGWMVNGDGDGYVDFGLYEATNHRFINNLERSILLDFNVDGNIQQLI